MKKLFAMFLTLVTLISVLSVPAFAADQLEGNQTRYGKDYTNPTVTSTDEYGETIYVSGTEYNNNVWPLSEAPTMEHTITLNGITFSNYLEHKEMDSKTIDTRKPIKIIQIRVGMGASMRSEMDNVEFMVNKGAGFDGINDAHFTDGNVESDLRQIKTNTPAYHDRTILSTGGYLHNYSYLDYKDIRPYTNGGRNEDGTWAKGLTWVFETEACKGKPKGTGNSMYEIRVDQGTGSSQTTYYFQVIVCDRTDFKDVEDITPADPVVPTNPTPTPPPAENASALPTTSKIYVDGVETQFEAYNINGNNYFKLRDVALALRGTAKQFQVVWNPSYKEVIDDKEVSGAIEMVSQTEYTEVGGEMQLGDGLEKNATLTKSPILKDGEKVTTLTGYNINGNNFFKLRDLGILFDFYVGWDPETSSVQIFTNMRYDYNS